MRRLSVLAYITLAAIACLWVVRAPRSAALPTIAPVSGAPPVSAPAATPSGAWLVWPVPSTILERFLDDSLPPLSPGEAGGGARLWLQVIAMLLGGYPPNPAGALSAAFPVLGH